MHLIEGGPEQLPRYDCSVRVDGGNGGLANVATFIRLAVAPEPFWPKGIETFETLESALRLKCLEIALRTKFCIPKRFAQTNRLSNHSTHRLPKCVFQNSNASCLVIRKSCTKKPLGKIAFNSLSMCENTKLSLVRLRR